MRVSGVASAAAAQVNPKRKPTPKEIKQARQLGIRIEPGSKKKVTAAQLNGIVQDVKKLPKDIRDQLKKSGSGIDLVFGRGITAHPRYRNLRGVKTPTPGDGNRTYDDVIGAASGSGQPAVIAANRVNPFGVDLRTSGSESVALHELGHNFDSVNGGLSNNKRWQQAFGQSRNQFDTDYLRLNANEAFAESFSDYFYSKQTRASLPQKVRNFFRGIARQFS